ncbi:MAG: hypothetical protein ACAI44_10750 [Candidatus Sericytochromatia bacterium]
MSQTEPLKKSNPGMARHAVFSFNNRYYRHSKKGTRERQFFMIWKLLIWLLATWSAIPAPCGRVSPAQRGPALHPRGYRPGHEQPVPVKDFSESPVVIARGQQ